MGVLSVRASPARGSEEVVEAVEEAVDVLLVLAPVDPLEREDALAAREDVAVALDLDGHLLAPRQEGDRERDLEPVPAVVVEAPAEVVEGLLDGVEQFGAGAAVAGVCLGAGWEADGHGHSS
jgi:hypothetical protein